MDQSDAFVAGERCRVTGVPGGPLDGLTFAVKDLVDVAGVPTGGGNPDWPRGRPVPARHAAVEQVLLNAGASVDRAPVGLSLVGARGSDLELLAVARRFAAMT